MPITSFRDLDVWRCSMELARCVYRATGTMPFPHRHEIGAQMRKAGVSTPSNLAEGFRQGALGAYLRHVRIAAGSTAELETQAELAADLRLWTPDAGDEVRFLAERSGQMLTALIRALEQKADKDVQWRRSRR
jgi:four helix bundle protein